MVPALVSGVSICQVTAKFDEPDTLALNRIVPLGATLWEDGVTVTLMEPGAGGAGFSPSGAFTTGSTLSRMGFSERTPATHRPTANLLGRAWPSLSTISSRPCRSAQTVVSAPWL